MYASIQSAAGVFPVRPVGDGDKRKDVGSMKFVTIVREGLYT